MAFFKKQKQQYQEKLKLGFENEKREMQARVEEGEILMTIISKEVHDNIGQLSTMIKMHLRKIGKLATDNTQITIIEAAHEFADELILNAREISYSLNSDLIRENGLFRMVSRQLEYIKTVKKINYDIEIDSDETAIAPDKALIIYRIVQEILNNILKHAHAEMVTVRIIYQHQFFKLTIRDDGQGFESSGFARESMGLKQMQQRARLLDGVLNINSEKGFGTIVTLSIEKLTN
ncbi:sensor histidine kinase [Pedobacter sp. UBA4863]|nr:ATP-binding protein [Pedobacter sp. UBA4863]